MTVPTTNRAYTIGTGSASDSVAVPHFATVAPPASATHFPLGKRWIDTVSDTEYVLTSFAASGGEVSAVWTLLGTADGSLNTLTTDDSTVVTPVSGNINLIGKAGELVTTGSGDDATIGLADPATAPGALTVVGLLTAEASATIDTAGTALNLGADNSGDAVNLAVGTVARAVAIANSAAAHTVTIGSTTGAASLTLQAGSGNFLVSPAVATTITLGSAANTGTMTLGLSTAGQTINIGNGINVGAQVVNIASGASGANSTVNILNGNGSAGTQTFNLLSSTRAGAINIATGAAAHVIIVGSASAGDITVDTAAGLSLDSATASNFTVTGATEDLTLASVGGSVNITADEAAADAIVIDASDAAGGITISAGTGGVNVTGDTNIAGDLNLTSVAKKISLNGGAATDFIGQATLTNGVATVLNTNIAASDRIFVTRSSKEGSTALGLFETAINASTSFTITALNPADATTQTNDESTVDYIIFGQD